MVTISQIEAAVKALPLKDRETLLHRLTQDLRLVPRCYDLVRDLFEVPGNLGASGHRDLSSNKKHLREFGRNPVVASK